MSKGQKAPIRSEEEQYSIKPSPGNPWGPGFLLGLQRTLAQKKQVEVEFLVQTQSGYKKKAIHVYRYELMPRGILALHGEPGTKEASYSNNPLISISVRYYYKRWWWRRRKGYWVELKQWL